MPAMAHTQTDTAADDLMDADGVAVLDYWQAQELARKRMVEWAHKGSRENRPLYGRPGGR